MSSGRNYSAALATSLHFVVLSVLLLSLTPVCSSMTARDFDLKTIGDNAVLGCVKDSSNDILRWERDGHNITNTTKYEILTDDNSSNLTVKNAGEGDVGVYQCFNQTNVDIAVNLNSKPFNDSTVPKSISLIEGETAVLKCSGWGWPAPIITWIRENPKKADDWTYVDGSGLEITYGIVITPHNVTLTRGAMNLTNVKQADQTSYRCVMENRIGTANLTVYVRVKDRLAAVWPFIGILVEAILLVIFIVVCEIRRRKKQAVD